MSSKIFLKNWTSLWPEITEPGQSDDEIIPLLEL